MSKLIKYIVLLVALMAMAIFGYDALTSDNTVVETNTTLPNTTDNGNDNTGTSDIETYNFTIYDMDNNKVELKDFKGKPIVINFFASWCIYCKEEMPSYQLMYDDNKDDAIFLMIDVVDNNKETEATARKFIADSGYTFPTYLDLDLDATNEFGISSFPSSYFFNEEGNLINYQIGLISERELKVNMMLLTDVVYDDIYLKLETNNSEAAIKDHPEAIIVDASSTDDYNNSHIVGAYNIKEDNIDDIDTIALEDYNIILVYAANKIDSEAISRKLISKGYMNVYDMGELSKLDVDTE